MASARKQVNELNLNMADLRLRLTLDLARWQLMGARRAISASIPAASC